MGASALPQELNGGSVVDVEDVEVVEVEVVVLLVEEVVELVVEVVDVVLVVGGSVVDVVLVVDVVDVLVVDVVVVVSHGQSGKSGGGLPTATFRQMSASVAETPPLASRSQMHSGVHVTDPTAAFRMNRQSVDVGVLPPVIGWPQSPCAAGETAGWKSASAETAAKATKIR